MGRREKSKVIKEKIDFTKTDKTILEFFAEVNKEYYREMILHMRETGVKIPIAGTNWSREVSIFQPRLWLILLTVMHIGIAGAGK